MKAYAGIGSRSTPDDVLALMERIAYRLAGRGWTLRSGGADGADDAFFRGAMRGMNVETLEPWPEIFLPWPNFNGRPDGPDYVGATPVAYEIASRFHPAWLSLKPGAKMLHARNTHQVLGYDCKSPSRFVLCWTPSASGSGGTGQALRIARHYGIPIRDLGNAAMLAAARRWVES